MYHGQQNGKRLKFFCLKPEDKRQGSLILDDKTMLKCTLYDGLNYVHLSWNS